MPNLNLDAATEAEILAAVNAGKEVITHTDLVSVPGYTGAGYIVFDPVSGDGSYKIGGGGNGALTIIKAIFEVAFWLFDSVKGIVKTNSIFALVQLFYGFSDIWEQCSGLDFAVVLVANIAFAALMIALTTATGGGALVAYSVMLGAASEVIFDAGIKQCSRGLY